MLRRVVLAIGVVSLAAAFLLSPRSFPGPPGRDRGRDKRPRRFGIDNVPITRIVAIADTSIPTDIVPEHRARPRPRIADIKKRKEYDLPLVTIVNNRGDYFPPLLFRAR